MHEGENPEIKFLLYSWKRTCFTTFLDTYAVFSSFHHFSFPFPFFPLIFSFSRTSGVLCVKITYFPGRKTNLITKFQEAFRQHLHLGKIFWRWTDTLTFRVLIRSHCSVTLHVNGILTTVFNRPDRNLSISSYMIKDIDFSLFYNRPHMRKR